MLGEPRTHPPPPPLPVVEGEAPPITVEVRRSVGVDNHAGFAANSGACAALGGGFAVVGVPPTFRLWMS